MTKQHLTRRLRRIVKSVASATLALAMAFGYMPEASIVRAANDVTITIDGETSDWDFIKKYLVDEDGFSQVAAFVSDTDLYVLRDLADAENYGTDHLFIDADGDHTNGYCNAGIDYMLEGTDLYYYTGEGGAWGWGGSQFKEFVRTTDNAIAEYRIPLESISKNAPAVGDDILIHIGCVKSDWTHMVDYPAGEITLAKVPTLEEAYYESNSPEISDFTLTTNGSLKAITADTMTGGTVAFFSAQGGNGQYKYSFAASKLYGKDNKKFAIEGNKLVVKDKLLSPGTYSVYVKVSSDIRSEKKGFSFTVGKADSTTTINESIFAGRDGEWFAVEHNTANSTPNLKELKAVTDGTDLYAYVSAEALSEDAEIYISTETTGEDMSDVWEDGSAIDYKVSINDGTLYKFENGSWNPAGTVSMNKSEIAAEIKVSLESLGKTEGEFLVGAMDKKDGEVGYLPNVGREMLFCTTPSMEEPPVVNFDGSSEDWPEKLKIAEGKDTVGDLYAFRDAENLYVLSFIQSGDWATSYAVSTNLFIDADGDSKTGYQATPTFKVSGADFLVQDWFSNTDAKNVEFFKASGTSGWTKIGDQSSGCEYKKYVNKEYANGEVVACEWVIPISVMEAQIGNVSSDIYVAVDRQTESLQGGTGTGYAPANASFAAVPKFRVGVKVKVDDGSFADWDSVSNRAYNTSLDSTCNLVATRSADRLYTLVTSDAANLSTVNLYYISTGKDTGYNFSTYKNIDYIVRDAKLFPVIADDTIGDEIADVWMNYYHDSIEMQLYLSDIGNPDKLEIGWRGVDGTYAIPADGLMAVTTTFNLGKDAGYYYPVEDFASFGNPCKGWVGWAGEFISQDGKPTSAEKFESGDLLFPRSAVYLAVRWGEYEPTKGNYDFEGIRKKYNLDFWKNHGVRINLRFVMDNPENQKAGEQRMDIPKWLYDELCEEAEAGRIDNAGTFYNDPANLGGGGFSPNYNSELLIGYHDKVIEQLAKDFDDNEMTAFVQIGSLGHWAEMHTWPEGTGVFPDPTTCNRYMESYTKYFHNVKLGLRKPYPYAAEHKFGLFNDIFGAGYLDGQGTSTFLGYINDGDVDMPHSTYEEVQASKMPDFWKYNYSGGEFSDGDPTRHLDNARIVESINEIRYTHVSWLGPCSPCDMDRSNLFALKNEANILAIQKAMGYNFAIEKITQLDSITAGQDTRINMVVNNEGVAPFYYDWPLEFSLIDSNGEVAYTKTVSSGITTWLPGRTSVDINLNISNSVKAGTYKLAIAVANKDTKEPGIRLAMRGGRDDLRYPLYDVNVSSTGTADVNQETGNSAGNGANAGASAGAGAAGSDTSSAPSGTTTTTTPAAVELTPATGVTTPAANAGNTGNTGNAGNGNAVDNTPADTPEEAVANGATAGAATAEEITIGNGETALADSLGAEDETPVDNNAEAVGTAAVEAAAGFNVWIILAVVLVIAAIAGFIMYRNAIGKGGQDNE